MQTRTWALCAVVALVAAPPLAIAQPVTDPQEFAQLAASSNMFEIESSQLALDEPVSDQVKQFAQRMIDDHTAAGEKMKTAAEKDGITPPDTMMEKQQSQLQKLESTDPDAFEKAYVSAQVAAHDEAVELFKTFSEDGQQSALRDFAAETLPTLQEHKAAAHDLAQAE